MEQPSIPTDIAKAIVAVMGQLGTLKKDGKNLHDNFKYMSVDKLFSEVGPIMAREGLFVLTNETATRIEQIESMNPKTGEVKMGSWLTANYDIFLCHSSGSVFGPIKRESRVLAKGPTAYGAAASFAEKYFLRGLLKIPTGDEDIDAMPQDGLPVAPHPSLPAAKKSEFVMKPKPNWTRIELTFSAAESQTVLLEKKMLAESLWFFSPDDQNKLDELAEKRSKQLASPEEWAEGRE